MVEAVAAGRSLAGKPGRLKWTDKMNQDLLECREKALSLKSSSNPADLVWTLKIGTCMRQRFAKKSIVEHRNFYSRVALK